MKRITLQGHTSREKGRTSREKGRARGRAGGRSFSGCLFPLAIKYNTHYSLLLTLILGYFSLENRMLTLNSKLLILLLNCVRLNLYALEI